MQVPKSTAIIRRTAENNLKTTCRGNKKTEQDEPALYVPRGGRVDPVITCTFTARWVASSTLYRFQLPAAEGSREACEPRLDPASRITKCGLKKDLSRTTQGTASQTPHPSQPPCGDVSVVPLLRLFPAGPASLGSSWRFFKFPSPNALLVGDFERFYSSSAKSSSMNSS